MHCVDKFNSIGVSDRELLNNLAALVELVEPIIIAFSKLLILDCTEAASGDSFDGLFPVKDNRGAG